MTIFQLTKKGKHAKPRAPQNVETWSFVKDLLLTFRELSWEQLSNACRSHNHPAGGDAFIPYLQRNKWIELAEQKS